MGMKLMFTGIIEKVCVVRSVAALAGGVRVGIEIGELALEAKIGDSIAVNGVCLTVTEISGGLAGFDVSGESLSKSTLKGLKAGDEVNIERAMKADGRFGGHFVLGHVDGVAKITSIEKLGDFWRVTVKPGDELAGQLVVKGSVAIDGISLTIASMGEDVFTIAVIPQTWESTNLGAKMVGSEVNIETDIIAKLIERQLTRAYDTKRQGLTMEKLKEMGF